MGSPWVEDPRRQLPSLSKASGHLIPECVQEVDELEINLACCISDFLGPTRHARRHRQNCSKRLPWRPEDGLNPGETPSLARGLPGNQLVSALTLGRGKLKQKVSRYISGRRGGWGGVEDLEKEEAGTEKSEIHQ